jgi:hypothetical protein
VLFERTPEGESNQIPAQGCAVRTDDGKGAWAWFEGDVQEPIDR